MSPPVVIAEIIAATNQPAIISGSAAILAALLTVYWSDRKIKKHNQVIEKKIGDPDIEQRDSLDAKLNRLIEISAATKARLDTYISEHDRRHNAEQAHRSDEQDY